MSLDATLTIHLTAVVGIAGSWILICWTQHRQNNVIAMLAVSLGWPAAILYFSFRYAAPWLSAWLSARIYRDALLLVDKQNAIKEVESFPRSPTETGIYD